MKKSIHLTTLFRLFMLTAVLGLAQQGRSQVVIGGWDVSTLPGGTNDFGPDNYAATETAANVTVGGLTRGVGVGTTGTGAARGWGGNNWGTSFNNGDSSVLFNDFFTFTVKANAGFALSLSSIGPFDYRRSATGPLFAEIQYRINAGAYSLITTVSFPSTSSGGASVGSTDLSGIPALQNLPSSSTVTFRIVPFRSTSTAGAFYIFDTGNSAANDFAVNGTLCALPACSITGPEDFVCSNSSGIIYSAPAGMASYNWSISGDGSIPGATNGQSVSVTSGNFLGSYTVAVTITNANGCSSTCSKQSDIFFPTPPADITVSPGTTLCFGTILDLSIATAASSTVAWSGEGITNSNGTFSPGDPFSIWGFINSTTAIPTSTGPHTYSVTVTSSAYYGGCSNTGTVNVTVNPLPAAPTCPSNSSVCLSAPAFALTGGSPGGGTYSGPGVSAGMFNPATAGAGTHTITYTVTDGNGCTNTCTFEITVLASCFIDFSGKIIFSNNNSDGVNNATVKLSGSANGSDLSDTNGDFFISTAVGSGSFTLTPTKTINKLNGVDVADVTAIQQHVANSVPITNLYKLVAADVNKSNSVNTVDASIINQSLLNNPAALAQFKTSWRFVPTSHTMTNPPWNFPEQRAYANITASQTNQDFYGIKTGDVTTDYANPVNFGASNPLTFSVQDQILQTGSEVTVEFKANQLEDLAAFQSAFHFDSEKLQFVEILPSTALPLTLEHFGIYNLAEGEIRVVWSQAEGAFLEESALVFSLKFNVLQGGGKLSEALSLDESELPAFAYNSALAGTKLEFKFSTVTGTGAPADISGVQLFQNRPNPFSGQTAIGFVLPRETEAQFRVYDVTGRVLFSQTKNYAAGRHEETLDLSAATGVLWYELVTPFGVLSRKMTALR